RPPPPGLPRARRRQTLPRARHRLRQAARHLRRAARRPPGGAIHDRRQLYRTSHDAADGVPPRRGTDAGVAGRHESYMAKIVGTELGFRVADRCLQIHGGMGLATEMPISQMWRDARSFMITEGQVEVMRMVLAREIFRGQV